ncbi:MAG: biopolymer transporter ExbD [Phycisphaerae bacterium]|nr:biopolymer transporter ExbD [Phycisphaerae bacterium]
MTRSHTRESPRAQRRRERRAAARASALPSMMLNMTAMIDVVFMLLIFFILTVDFRPREDALSLDAQKRIESATPGSGGSGDPFSLPERPVVVFVRSTGDGPGEYLIQTDEPILGSPASSAELRSRAAAARGTTLPASQPFSIRPSTDARWEHTLAAFSALQKAGFREIILANPGGGT